MSTTEQHTCRSPHTTPLGTPYTTSHTPYQSQTLGVVWHPDTLCGLLTCGRWRKGMCFMSKMVAQRECLACLATHVLHVSQLTSCMSRNSRLACLATHVLHVSYRMSHMSCLTSHVPSLAPPSAKRPLVTVSGGVMGCGACQF